MSIVFQKRRDTAANLQATNRIYAQGEPILEIDTLREKDGDGLTAYNELPYKDTGSTTSTGSTTENVYDDMAALYAGQADQTFGKYQYVVNASAHSQVTSGFAMFEKLVTNGGVEADYRLLSAFETNAVLTGSTYNAFTVLSIDLSVAATVATGSMRVQYENGGNKITHLLFDIPFTKYLKGFADIMSTRNLELKFVNKSTQKTLVASITGFAYSNGSNKYYKVAIENIVNVSDVAVNDVMEVQISISPVAAAGGVQSVTGDGVGGTGTDPVLAFPTPAQISAQATSEKGTAGGYASLDGGGKVPAAQLPSYVDDSIEGYLDTGVFYEDAGLTTPITGETGKVYVDLAGGANKSYRWTGSVYVRIDDVSASEVKTLYESNDNTNAFTDAEQTKLSNIDASEANENIATTKTLNHNFKYFGIKTMTAATTFSDSNLVVDGITRGMYLTGNFVPTFPAYWEADPNSEAYDGTVKCRVTWDVLNATGASEDVRYTITVLAS